MTNQTEALTEDRIKILWGGAVIRNDTTGAQLLDFARGIEAEVRAAISSQPPAPEEAADMVVSAYRIGTGPNAIKIERAQQTEGPDKWAVRQGGNCLSHTGEWEWEPMPSSRDDAFLERCRFDTAQQARAPLTGTASTGGKP